MLGFLSPTMDFKFFTKPQPSEYDHAISYATKEFQDQYAQYKKIEKTDDPAYLSLTKKLMAMQSELEKMLDERITSSRDSFLRPLHVHTPSSLTSSSSSRCPLSSSIGSNDLSRFHDKPIFDEDMSTHHALFDPRHTL